MKREVTIYVTHRKDDDGYSFIILDGIIEYDWRIRDRVVMRVSGESYDALILSEDVNMTRKQATRVAAWVVGGEARKIEIPQYPYRIPQYDNKR